MATIIKTNHHDYPIMHGSEISKKIYEKEFDNHYDTYEDFAENARIVKYKDMWFDTNEDFLCVSTNSHDKETFKDWEGIMFLTYDSGVLIKRNLHDETAKMAYFYNKEVE